MAINTFLNAGEKDWALSDSKRLQIQNTSTSSDALTLECTNDNSASGPIMTLTRISASPAQSDVLGKIQFKGKDSNNDTIRYASIDAKIRDEKKGTDDSALVFTTRVGGQHKSMLVVQNDGVIVHVDKPLMLQAQGYKKTRLFGTKATGRRDIYFPDQAGTVMVNESGKVMAPDLPTSDPTNAGQLWNDSGTIKISAG